MTDMESKARELVIRVVNLHGEMDKQSTLEAVALKYLTEAHREGMEEGQAVGFADLSPGAAKILFNAGMEEAAKVADRHRGKPWTKGMPPESRIEIDAEERGEQIASEEIAAAIREKIKG